MKYLLCSLLACACLTATSVAAQDSGKELAQVTFTSTDTNRDGVLTFAEVETMNKQIAQSMDSNEDQFISREEFMVWDFGFHYLAEQQDDTPRYEAVKRVMFGLYDRDNSGRIDPVEQRINLFWTFSRADLNHNRILSQSEYLNAWMPLLILKSGLGK